MLLFNIFHKENFRILGQSQKYFNRENFTIYGMCCGHLPTSDSTKGWMKIGQKEFAKETSFVIDKTDRQIIDEDACTKLPLDTNLYTSRFCILAKIHKDIMDLS